MLDTKLSVLAERTLSAMCDKQLLITLIEKRAPNAYALEKLRRIFKAMKTDLGSSPTAKAHNLKRNRDLRTMYAYRYNGISQNRRATAVGDIEGLFSAYIDRLPQLFSVDKLTQTEVYFLQLAFIDWLIQTTSDHFSMKYSEDVEQRRKEIRSGARQAVCHPSETPTRGLQMNYPTPNQPSMWSTTVNNQMSQLDQLAFNFLLALIPIAGDIASFDNMVAHKDQLLVKRAFRMAQAFTDMSNDIHVQDDEE